MLTGVRSVTGSGPGGDVSHHNGPAATHPSRPTFPARRVTADQRWVMLALATLGFALNFWAWALLSPLGPRFGDTLALTSFDQALLVALPVVVGSVGRIPVGALTDRFGGRVMFPLVSAVTVVPVLYLGLAGHSSLPALLVGGFFLGVAGTSFAVGVPFVNAWFPPEHRGLAIGIFGAGMGGTAISALTTVDLVDRWGVPVPFVVTAVALAVSTAGSVLVAGRVSVDRLRANRCDTDSPAPPGWESPGSPRSCTRCCSAVMWRSRCTCRRISEPGTTWPSPTRPAGWPASCCWRC